MMIVGRNCLGNGRCHPFIILSCLFLFLLAGCGGLSAAELAEVDFTPLARDDWQVSTPAAEGMDPELVAKLYQDASELETIYSLLLVRNGRLVAEGYFHDGAVDQQINIQSVTKSVNSALVGLALAHGCLAGIDQKMLDFFPELAGQISDPRKAQITIQQLLQMRAGYPWEEEDPALWEALWSGDYLPLIVHFPLTAAPGARYQYSNLTADWLGMIVARACETDLRTFAEAQLFVPLGITPGDWTQDQDGYHMGYGELHLSARDMAKFGLLYLNNGVYNDTRLLSAGWVQDSLATYSEDAWQHRVGPNFNDVGYGYQWWSVQAGSHAYNLAWGHGGQQIAVVDALNLVVVVTADPLYGQSGDGPWAHEKANLNLVADFIASLPGE